MGKVGWKLPNGRLLFQALAYTTATFITAALHLVTYVQLFQTTVTFIITAYTVPAYSYYVGWFLQHASMVRLTTATI